MLEAPFFYVFSQGDDHNGQSPTTSFGGSGLECGYHRWSFCGIAGRFALNSCRNTRPCLKMIPAQHERPGKGGGIGQLFLQQAETVKLISPTSTTSGHDLEKNGTAADGWYPLSVTDVEGGELLLLREISRGTHVGRAIDAVVTES